MPTNLTPEQLEQWNQLCERATPGPLEVRQYGFYELNGVGVRSEDEDVSSVFECDEDAAFYVTARTAMPALIAEVKRLEERERVAKRILEDITTAYRQGAVRIESQEIRHSDECAYDWHEEWIYRVNNFIEERS